MRPLTPLMFLFAILAANGVSMLLFDAATEPAGVYYLDFTGGTVSIPQMYPIPTRATLRIPPFQPLSLDPVRVKKLVIEFVRRDFARWPGVEILEGEMDELPDANVVMVGGWSRTGVLGIASTVDVGDRSSDDRAVVFSGSVTETLTGGSRLVPSEEAVAQAVANVVSHEMGHLLGFAHVAGGRCEIMSPGLSQEGAATDQMFLRHHQAYVDRRLLWCATK